MAYLAKKRPDANTSSLGITLHWQYENIIRRCGEGTILINCV